MLKNLKLLREKQGISQQKLADIIGKTQPSIYKYENEDYSTEPDIQTLCDIANYFDTSIDFLVGRTDVRQNIKPLGELNEQEAELIELFRAVSVSKREAISRLMREML